MSSSSSSFPLEKFANVKCNIQKAPRIRHYMEKTGLSSLLAEKEKAQKNTSTEKPTIVSLRQNLVERPFVATSLLDHLRHHRLLAENSIDQTHGAFDGLGGGILKIADPMLLSTLKVLAKGFRGGFGDGKSALYEVLRCQRLRFFMDIDLRLKKHEKLPIAYLRRLIGQSIQGVMHKFFPLGDHQVVVSYAVADTRTESEDYKQFANYPGHYFRHGIHLNWPHVIVTLIEAKIIAEYIRQTLKIEFGNDPECSELCWNAISEQVDTSPYYDRGSLRMMYQAKMETCTFCDKAPKFITQINNKKTEIALCPVCQNNRKLMAGRIYTPLLVLDEKGEPNADELQRMEMDPLHTLIETCLRVPLVMPLREDFVEPSGGHLITATSKELEMSQVQLVDDPMPYSRSELPMRDSSESYFKLAESGNYEKSVECQKRFISKKSVQLKEKEELLLDEKRRLKQYEKNAKYLGPELASSPVLRDDPEIAELWKQAAQQGDGLRQVPLTAEYLIQIQDFIRTLHPKWTDFEVGQVFGNCQDGRKWVNVFPLRDTKTAQSAARYCLNKNGYHNSSTVWFYIDGRGKIHQKCRCQKAVERSYGTCRNLRHYLCTLPYELSTLLVDYPKIMEDKDEEEKPVSSSSYSSIPVHMMDRQVVYRKIPTDYSTEEKTYFMQYVMPQLDLWCHNQFLDAQHESSHYIGRRLKFCLELCKEADLHVRMIRKEKGIAPALLPSSSSSSSFKSGKEEHGKHKILAKPPKKRNRFVYSISKAQDKEQEESDRLAAEPDDMDEEEEAIDNEDDDDNDDI